MLKPLHIKSWQRSLWLALGLLIPALAWLVYPAQSAEIDAAPYSAKWILSVEFVNNGITATRTNQLYRKRTLLKQWSESVTCQTNGAVTLGLDRATFAGGYVQCDLPSFRDAVFVYTGGRILLANSCSNSGRNVNFWGLSRVDAVDFNASATQPIVTHPDYQAQFTLLEAQNGPDVQLRLEAGPMTTDSIPFSLPAAETQLGSRLNMCDGSNCRGQHTLDGVLLNKEGVAQGAPWNGTSGPTTVYLGTDGVNFFRGEMLRSDWDPGCIVRQG